MKLKRELIKKERIMVQDYNSEKNNSFDLGYFLIVPYNDTEKYGIQICKVCDGIVVEESVEDYHVKSELEAKEFIDKLASNKVTPCTLGDIIEEDEKIKLLDLGLE